MMLATVVLLLGTTEAARLADGRSFSETTVLEGTKRLVAAPPSYAKKVHAPTRQLRLEAEEHGLNVTLELSRATSIFGEQYAEIIDGEPIRRGAHRTNCHFDGDVIDTAGSPVGRVTAHLCGGALEAVVRIEGKGVYEVRWLEEERGHVIFDALANKQDFKCGVANHDHHDDHEDHHDHVDEEELSVAAALRGVRRKLPECTGSEIKYVDVVAYNDAIRYAEYGEQVEDNTALIFRLVAELWDTVDLTATFQCEVRVRLLGQITWRSNTPSSMQYNYGNDCTGCGSDSCSANELSSTCLLQSFAQRVQNDRPQLAALFGKPVDNAHLITGADFSQGSVGLGYVGSLCGATSASVESSSSGSVLFVATVVAHELGHNFGMEHDADPGDDNDHIMSAFSPFAPAGSNLEFSEESRAFASAYIESRTPACLDDSAMGVTGPICGDDIVEGMEECDQGFWITDSCCVNCVLQPGCECALSDECCDATGQIVPMGTLCREKKHETCDFSELCNGEMSSCPVDLFEEPGAPCDPDQGSEGRCFRGRCASEYDNCRDPDEPFTCGSLSDCGDFYCSSSTEVDRICYTSGPSVDGVSCGTNRQCRSAAFENQGDDPISNFASQCAPSSSLAIYHWYLGENGCNLPARCRDSTGVVVSSDSCDPAEEPTMPRAACTFEPSISPLPSVSPHPTPIPTPKPTSIPTITPVPTHSSPRFGSESSSSSTTSKKISGTGFAVTVALLVIVIAACSACIIYLCCPIRLFTRKQSQPPVMWASTERSAPSGGNNSPLHRGSANIRLGV